MADAFVAVPVALDLQALFVLSATAITMIVSQLILDRCHFVLLDDPAPSVMPSHAATMMPTIPSIENQSG